MTREGTGTRRITSNTRITARVAAALTASALVAVLAGCSPPPAPTPPPTADPTPSESATPTPDPVAEPLIIPTCETLLPIALAQSEFGASVAFLGENVPTAYYPWWQLPAMNAAIAGVTVARACTWGIPNSDGAFTMFVAEIDPATRASVEAALTAEGFSSVVMGTVTAREAERDGLFQLEAETHLFTGDVWILVDDSLLSLTGVVAGSALDALRTANPTLGL